MTQLTLQVPEGLQHSELDTKRFLAAKMFEAGRVTLAQGAVMAGLSSVAFAEILTDYGVSLINYPATDIAKDAARI